MIAIRIHRKYTTPRTPTFIIRTGALQTNPAGYKEFQCPHCGLWEMETPELWKRRYCCHRCVRYYSAPWWFERKSEIDDYVTLPKSQPVKPSTPESVTRRVESLFPDMRTGNICECCGKAFETARSHAATCSAKCRKRKSRGMCK